MQHQPLDEERAPAAADDSPNYGALSRLVTGWAAVACLGSLVAIREGPTLVGAVNLPVWCLVLLYQYRTYKRRRVPSADDDAAA